MADWLVDATRLEFDPSASGGGGAVNSVSATSPISSTGGANPDISLQTPLAPQYGGTGQAAFAPGGGYVKSPGGIVPFTVQAVPIPVTDGGTGSTVVPADTAVVSVQGGVYSGDATKFSWDDVNKRLGLGTSTPAYPLHIVDAVQSPTITLDSNPNPNLGVGLYMNADGGQGILTALGSTYAGSGMNRPLNVRLDNVNANGHLALGASGAAGLIEFYTNGTTSASLRGSIEPFGRWNFYGPSCDLYQLMPLVNGLNSNIPLTSSYVHANGPTNDYIIGGFDQYSDGQRLTIYCSSFETVTVRNEDALTLPVQRRIRTLTGADITMSPGKPCFLDFVWDAIEQRWIFESQSNMGFLLADGSVPLTADWAAGPNSIFAGNLTTVFNVVSGYGADSGGTVDCTSAVNAAISACALAGGGIVYFPPGTYRVVQSGAVVPFVVTAGNITIMGSGRGVTNISFEPAAGGACFQFNNGAVPINYNRICDLSFRSPDYTVQKTMIQAYDLNNFEVERVSNTPGLLWAGNGSIGIHFRGRQELRTRDCEISADFPVVIDTDPNIATIAFDHSSLEDSDFAVSNVSGTATFTATDTITLVTPAPLVANMYVGWTVNQGGTTATVLSNTLTTITFTGVWGGALGAGLAFRAQPPNYNITIRDNTSLTNLVFRNLALVCGVGGITWNNTLMATASMGFQIDNIRTEQSIQTGSYAIDLRTSASQLQGLSIKNAVLESGTHGIRLTGAQWPSCESITYAGGATRNFLNLSATVSGFSIKDSFYQAGSAIVDASTGPSAINLTQGANPPYTTFNTLANPSPFALQLTGSSRLTGDVVTDSMFISQAAPTAFPAADANRVWTFRSGGGGGSYPFNEAGHLILQARQADTRGILFATGTTPRISGLVDGTGKFYTNYGTATWNGVAQMGGVVFTQTADSTTTANTLTTLFGTGVGSLTLPANLLIAGRMIRINLAGYVSAADGGAGTKTLNLYLGGTNIATAASGATFQTVLNAGWTCECWMTCRTAGAGGTVTANGIFLTQIAAAAPVGVISLATGTSACNTTGTLVIDVKFNNGNATGTIRTTSAVVEILN
jgi:hypothetical protein